MRTFHFGEHISTAKYRPDALILKGCQSPPHRGTHFYTSIIIDESTTLKCQSPSPRGTHFYRAITLNMSHPATCVNPLHLGELISTKGRFRGGTHFYKFWSFLPILAVSFQIHGFISATQYDRRSTLLTPCGFYSGDLLSLPRCIQQTYVQCMLVVRVFPPIRITLPLSSRKCRPRHKPRLSHPAIWAAARLTQNMEPRQCSVPLLPTGI